MILTVEAFQSILIALVELRINRAKSRMTELYRNASFKSKPDFYADFTTYWRLVQIAYDTKDPQRIPRAFGSATRVNIGKPEMQTYPDLWLTQGLLALETFRFDLNLVADQLNHDFGTSFTFSPVPIGPGERLKITYMLKDTASIVTEGLFSVAANPVHEELCVLEVVNKNTHGY
jgi:hypothetical protein